MRPFGAIAMRNKFVTALARFFPDRDELRAVLKMLVVLVSDGPKVMMGRHAGFGEQLKAIASNN